MVVVVVSCCDGIAVVVVVVGDFIYKALTWCGMARGVVWTLDAAQTVVACVPASQPRGTALLFLTALPALAVRAPPFFSFPDKKV